MPITDVQSLSGDHGTRVVPDPRDYDDHSAEWTETEFRAHMADTGSVAGYWEGEPGWMRIDDWPYNEVCVILRGRVAVEDEDHERREYGAGDAFLIPVGFAGTWHTLEPTRKIFVGVVPDSPVVLRGRFLVRTR